MIDTLISPAVGGVMWAAAAGTAAYSIKKLQKEADDKKIPMMGVMGAFVFAAQMINFAIPGTGSSGHIGGGMLLAILLGPYAGFMTMASVLLIQALVFADGGLLAFGCNLINMGFFTCFVAYPLIYRIITKKGLTAKRIFPAAILSSIASLQLGAFSVVLETLFSGKTDLPFGVFLLYMQPIHLAIGVVDGIVTATVINFVWKARPEILESVSYGKTLTSVPIKKVIIGFLIAAVVLGGFVSWFAATDPDGLEWSVQKVTGALKLQNTGDLQKEIGKIQDKTAILHGYSTPSSGLKHDGKGAAGAAKNTGTSISGIIGGAATLILAVILGIAARFRKNRKKGVDKRDVQSGSVDL